MREKWQKQIPLMPQIKDHAQSKELEVISNIIDENPTICALVLQDLNRGKSVAYRKGADGMRRLKSKHQTPLSLDLARN